MLLASLTDASTYSHLFVAPHLDDAALSCGGQIARLTAEGIPVLVVTLCAGRPSGAELSPFAQYLHGEWGLGADPIGRRREEDAAALQLLDCDSLHLELLDAPYRVADYGVGNGWRGTVVADDPLVPAVDMLLAQLHAQQPHARLYVPLGVGNHVDHQVVCAAGLRLHMQGADVVWYEDAPYAAKQPESIGQRLAALPTRFTPMIVDITAELPRKLRAIAEYRSQLQELFGAASMVEVMTDYAAAVTGIDGQLGERVWLRER